MQGNRRVLPLVYRKPVPGRILRNPCFVTQATRGGMPLSQMRPAAESRDATGSDGRRATADLPGGPGARYCVELRLRARSSMARTCTHSGWSK
jgi:hypothetical protein